MTRRPARDSGGTERPARPAERRSRQFAADYFGASGSLAPKVDLEVRRLASYITALNLELLPSLLDDGRDLDVSSMFRNSREDIGLSTDDFGGLMGLDRLEVGMLESGGYAYASWLLICRVRDVLNSERMKALADERKEDNQFRIIGESLALKGELSDSMVTAASVAAQLGGSEVGAEA